MRPTNWTTPLALTAALVLGLFLGSALTTTTPRALAQQSSTTPRTWPPAPRDIVSLPAPKTQQPIGTGLGVPGYLYYEVPADRALVITDAFAGENTSLALWEDINQTTNAKINVKALAGHRTEYHSAVGASFAPGSKIVMLQYTPDIHLTGYLTPP